MLLFLTAIWCGFSNNFTVVNILFGMTVSLLCMRLLTDSAHPSPQRFHIHALLVLVSFTIYELVKSSLQVAWEIVTPQQLSHPQIITVPIDCVNKVEVMLLTSLISITPGTLFIDFNQDESAMMIHSMFAHNPKHVHDFIKRQLEPKVLRVFGHGSC
jgi:multicomponent Na+:H+ antiporter subunit E